MTVAEMLARMSSRELSEWQAYDRLEPVGEWRGDWRAAMLASTFVNMWRSRDDEPARPDDFMPFVPKPEAVPQEPDRMKRMAREIDAAARKAKEAKR